MNKIQLLVSHLKEKDNLQVLDLGCGNGDFLVQVCMSTILDSTSILKIVAVDEYKSKVIPDKIQHNIDVDTFENFILDWNSFLKKILILMIINLIMKSLKISLIILSFIIQK